MKYKNTILKHFRSIILSAAALLLMLTLSAAPLCAYAVVSPPPAVPPVANNKCANGSLRLGVPISGTQPCLANGSGANNPFLVYIKAILKVLSIGVGIAVVGGVVWGGIKYTTARGNASQTQAAISTIINAVIGLLLYIFMFAVLNFLIPGGIFG
jgi:hypothetical protein